jgi:hypothetical protein
MRYTVLRGVEGVAVDSDWNKPLWRAVEPLVLTHHMGDAPAHRPLVQAKLLYDDIGVMVIFRVDDRYVRAVARNHQDVVCTDSCVEFFFTPGVDPAAGYFNLEMNCGGTMWFRHQTIPRQGQPVSPDGLKRIAVAHSMPRIVDPEIADRVTWTVEYRLPFDILTAYDPGAVRPAPGVTWRANFFKCADHTSHPHWLTWAKVDRARPDFHLPEFFGTLEFGV